MKVTKRLRFCDAGLDYYMTCYVLFVSCMLDIRRISIHTCTQKLGMHEIYVIEYSAAAKPGKKTFKKFTQKSK